MVHRVLIENHVVLEIGREFVLVARQPLIHSWLSWDWYDLRLIVHQQIHSFVRDARQPARLWEPGRIRYRLHALCVHHPFVDTGGVTHGNQKGPSLVFRQKWHKHLRSNNGFASIKKFCVCLPMVFLTRCIKAMMGTLMTSPCMDESMAWLKSQHVTWFKRKVTGFWPGAQAVAIEETSLKFTCTPMAARFLA